MNDGKHDRVLYAFAMHYGFTELTRVSSRDSFVTPPVALPDGTAVIGSFGGVISQFGPTLADFTAVSALGLLTPPPTRRDWSASPVGHRCSQVSNP